MPDYIDILINRNRKRGILLDTSPLLLLFVGTSDVNLVDRFKHTAKYTIRGYNLLTQLVDQFDRIITTPNILTETSNLLDYIPGGLEQNHCETIVKLMDFFKEEYTPSEEIFPHNKFYEFGLADLVTLECAKNKYLVLTDDRPLYGYLLNEKVDVIYFTELIKPAIFLD